MTRAFLLATVPALLFCEGGAAAQAVQAVEADQPQGVNAPAPAEQTGNEIVVTGFRRSLDLANDAKRRADVVSDVISAEDIGQFPDLIWPSRCSGSRAYRLRARQVRGRVFPSEVCRRSSRAFSIMGAPWVAAAPAPSTLRPSRRCSPARSRSSNHRPAT